MKSWHRRHRRLFVLLGLACGLVILTSLVLTRVWPSQTWALGFVGGVAAAFFLTVRWSGPGWIENWQFGAWGEQSTAKALRPLEKAGWVVLHDLPAGRGNVDHIAVGPGGVFLLDSKRLGGSAVVDDRGVTVHRFGDSDLSYSHPGPGHLLSLARQTHDRVLARTRIKVWVTPVMVLWGEFPQRTVEGQCVYLHGEELAQWLDTPAADRSRSGAPDGGCGACGLASRVGVGPGVAPARPPRCDLADRARHSREALTR